MCDDAALRLRAAEARDTELNVVATCAFLDVDLAEQWIATAPSKRATPIFGLSETPISTAQSLAAEPMPIGKGSRGPGRPLGAPNRATREIREALTLIVTRNIPRLQASLNKLAKHNPHGYIASITALCEFAIPKLSRLEIRPPAPSLPIPNFGISFANGGPGLHVPRTWPTDAARPRAAGRGAANHRHLVPWG